MDGLAVVSLVLSILGLFVFVSLGDRRSCQLVVHSQTGGQACRHWPHPGRTNHWIRDYGALVTCPRRHDAIPLARKGGRFRRPSSDSPARARTPNLPPPSPSQGTRKRGRRPTRHRHESYQIPHPLGEMAAYGSSDPDDGKKHPAIIWLIVLSKCE